MNAARFAQFHRERKVAAMLGVVERCRIRKGWTHGEMHDVVRGFNDRAWASLADTAALRSGVNHGTPSNETRALVLARLSELALEEAAAAVVNAADEAGRRVDDLTTRIRRAS